MGFAVRVRSAGQKYGPTCHQRDRADVTEFVTLVRLSLLGHQVGVLALAGYKRRKSALTAGPITPSDAYANHLGGWGSSNTQSQLKQYSVQLFSEVPTVCVTAESWKAWCMAGSVMWQPTRTSLPTTRSSTSTGNCTTGESLPLRHQHTNGVCHWVQRFIYSQVVEVTWCTTLWACIATYPTHAHEETLHAGEKDTRFNTCQAGTSCIPSKHHWPL